MTDAVAKKIVAAVNKDIRSGAVTLEQVKLIANGSVEWQSHPIENVILAAIREHSEKHRRRTNRRRT